MQFQGRDARGVPYFHGGPEALEPYVWLAILCTGCLVAGVGLICGPLGAILGGVAGIALARRAAWWLRVSRLMPAWLTIEQLASHLGVESSDLSRTAAGSRLLPRANLDGADLYEAADFQAGRLLRPADPQERLLRPVIGGGTPAERLLRIARPDNDTTERNR